MLHCIPVTVFLFFPAAAGASPLPFTGAYEQSFDALPGSGNATLTGTGAPGNQAAVPGLPGWQAARYAGSSTAALVLSPTPSTTGRLYAWGETGSPDRALGSLASSSTVCAFGAAFQNASAEVYRQITVCYTREIWTVQGTSTPQPFEDRLRFAWGIGPSGVTDANFLTWPSLTPLPELDARSAAPATVTGVTGSSTPDRQRTGNADPWREPRCAILTGLHWAPGQTLYLRWQDADDPGFDAGLAVDDFALSASPDPAPVPATLQPDTPGQLRLEWPTLPGMIYRAEDSSQLSTWSPLTVLSRRAAAFSLAEAVPVQPGNRFFRVVEEPQSKPDQEVFFSSPGREGTEPDLTLENKIIALLDHTPAGATVRAAIYTWTRETMSAAFIDAHQRGVDVRLIIGSEFPAVDLLLTAMPGRVTICRNGSGDPIGCNGGRINHNKFVTFSSLDDGSTDVSLQSSANFTDTQLPNANNTVIIRRDASLHAAYRKFWDDLSRQPENPQYYRIADGDAGTRLYMFPRADADGVTGVKDTIVEQLDAIDPAAGGSLYITMAFWTSPRRAIAERLATLRKAGFTIGIVADAEETSVEILQILRAAGIPVVSLSPIHSKYLLMDAVYEGRRQQLVFTGSHNYTGPALRENDETLLRLANPRLYQDFLSDWRRLAAHPLGH